MNHKYVPSLSCDDGEVKYILCLSGQCVGRLRSNKGQAYVIGFINVYRYSQFSVKSFILVNSTC